VRQPGSISTAQRCALTWVAVVAALFVDRLRPDAEKARAAHATPVFPPAISPTARRNTRWKAILPDSIFPSKTGRRWSRSWRLC